jgi:hypothetical protein
VHLVDIINQTDWVEHIDGEDKLGQPMIQFSMTKDWGTLDSFVLPYFRERTFPGRHGRLRPSMVIDTDHPLYESSSKEHDWDPVIRYSRAFGNCDFGIYFEYTFFSVAGSRTDLGLVVEYAYDERGESLSTTSVFEDDPFLGMRLTPNDVADTQLLAGVMQDVDGDENVLILEASRRFGSHWRMTLETWIFADLSRESRIYDFRDDDFVRMEMAYYF